MSTREENLGILIEKVNQLERRCDKKEMQIDGLMEFKNRLLGYALAISTLSAVITSIFINRISP